MAESMIDALRRLSETWRARKTRVTAIARACQKAEGDIRAGAFYHQGLADAISGCADDLDAILASFQPEGWRPIQRQQAVDLVMQEIALRHGASTRRDFEVACITVEAVEAMSKHAPPVSTPEPAKEPT